MIDFAQDVERSLASIRAPRPERCGTLVRLVGLRLEARGIMAPIGTCCEVMGRDGQRVEAEVVGFQDKTLFLMPFTEPVGIGPGALVRIVPGAGQVCLGSQLLGRVIDGRGAPLDGMPAPRCDTRLSMLGLPVNPMERGPIDRVLDVGVKAINGLLTIGRGQRIGLVAGSGVGKSVLLGMLTRFTQADVVVIGLIGERGREVQAFIQETLGAQGLAKAVVVASPANVSPVLRLKAAQMTHLIAEYFRDQGKDVLMLVDSLTRVAHWRAADGQGLPAFGVWLAAQSDRARRPWAPRPWVDHRDLHSAGRGRRRARPDRRHCPRLARRAGDALAQAGRRRALPGHRPQRIDFAPDAVLAQPGRPQGGQPVQAAVVALPAKHRPDSGRRL
jgi:FliI/YscN family ATPase